MDATQPTSQAHRLITGNDQQSCCACTQALEISEVLEEVLLQLPPRQLLVAQRVSKIWKASIEGSPSIQRATFQRPITMDNSFVTYKPHHDPTDKPSQGTWQFPNDNRPTKPLWNFLGPEPFDLLWHGRTGLQTKCHYTLGQTTTRGQLRELAEDMHAAWNRMQIMQPPCHKLVYRCGAHPKREYYIHAQDTTEGKRSGITFGNLVGGLQQHLDSEEHRNTCVTPAFNRSLPFAEKKLGMWIDGLSGEWDVRELHPPYEREVAISWDMDGDDDDDELLKELCDGLRKELSPAKTLTTEEVLEEMWEVLD